MHFELCNQVSKFSPLHTRNSEKNTANTEEEEAAVTRDEYASPGQ